MQPGFSDNSTSGGPVVTDGSFEASAEPLRNDAEGKPVYPEWTDLDPAPPLTNTVGEPEHERAADDGIIKYGDAPEDDPAPEPEAKPDPPSEPKPDQDRLPALRGDADLEALEAQVNSMSNAELMEAAGIEPIYSTSEVADFFNRTPQWVYWGMRPDEHGHIPFVWDDNTPIVPERIGDPETGRRRFTLRLLKAILRVSYKRGNILPDELKTILRRIYIDEHGGDFRAIEGWPKNRRGNYVHPKRYEELQAAARDRREAKEAAKAAEVAPGKEDQPEIIDAEEVPLVEAGQPSE